MTIHNTPHATGEIKSLDARLSDSATVGNGERIKTATVGIMTGVITDKCGHSLLKFTLRDITRAP